MKQECKKVILKKSETKKCRTYKDKAHSLLISRLGLKDQWYDSKVIKALPDKENPLNRVNQVHARLKDFLNAHSSFNRGSLQCYLKVFSFAMNPPRGYLEKVDALLNLIN